MTIIVDDADASNYRLVITPDGELEARQPLDGDRVRRYTTAENADSFALQTHSEFGLSIDDVIERYTAYADPETSRYQLAVSTAVAFQRQIPSHTHETSPDVGDNDSPDGADDMIKSGSDLELNERQRNVLSPDTGDTTTPQADGNSDPIPVLIRTREMLNRLDPDRLDDESRSQLTETRTALDALITSTME